MSNQVPFAAYPKTTAAATWSGDGVTPANVYLSIPSPGRRIRITEFITTGSLKLINVRTMPNGGGSIVYSWTPTATPQTHFPVNATPLAVVLNYEDQQTDQNAGQVHFEIANAGGSALTGTIRISGESPR